MLGISWKHAELVHTLWLAFAIVGLLLWLDLRGRGALGRFVSAVMARRLAERLPIELRVARLVFILGTLWFGSCALMRPQAEGDTETVTSENVQADIMVALDVSRSMLAEDAPPNRLSRAKAEIGKLVDQLKGHRIGLVAFAGRAAVLSPLTSDYSFFRMVLRDVDTKTVKRGGTRIGDAINKAVDAFGEGSASRIILLITDGEDHDSYPVEAAKKAHDAGIAIVPIGFGSEEGSQIIITDSKTGARSPLLDSNQTPVVSRLDGKTLRQIAEETKGVYVPAGVAALDLESIVKEHVKPIVRAGVAAEVRARPSELYPWFILGSLICLVLAVWVGGVTAREVMG